ncbi:MAG: hypothetical protein Q8J64_04830 [Thermodesulfovibrionales bacterium]|nr:hypothetical protein [Thermodesulfovibrionales bacterium]
MDELHYKEQNEKAIELARGGKLEEAVKIFSTLPGLAKNHGQKHEAYYNWGTALSDLAKLKALSFNDISRAIRPRHPS